MKRGPKKPERALKSKGDPAAAQAGDGDWLTAPSGKVYIVPRMPTDDEIDAALAKIRRQPT